MDIYNGERMGTRYANRVRSLTISDVSALGKQTYIESVTQIVRKFRDNSLSK